MTAPVTVYRVGPVLVGEHTPDLLDRWAPIDDAKPAHHPVRRSDAIYASPNLHGLGRWLSNALHYLQIHEIEVYAIQVDPDEVYTYWISHYDQFENAEDDAEYTNAIIDYWATGTTLTEWFETGDPSTGDDMEVLLAPNHVLSFRDIPYPELVEIMTAHGMDDFHLQKLRQYAAWFAA